MEITLRQSFVRLFGTTCSLGLLASVGLAQGPESSTTAAASTQTQAVAAAARAAEPSSPQPKASLGSSTTDASARRPAVGPEEHARLLREAALALATPDPVAIQEALETLGALAGRGAAQAIVVRLRGGLPPQLTERALEILGALNQPLASSVLVEYTQHRRWQIRQKAVAALGALRVRSTISVLLFALDDPSSEVRATAAAALGNVGDVRALAPLTAALERGVEGALTAIARIGSNRQLDFVLTRAKADLEAGEPALWAWLSRSNAPAATKVKIIKTLDEWNTEPAREVLARWQQRLREGEGDARLLSTFKTIGKVGGPS